jgi:hypothetical protein
MYLEHDGVPRNNNYAERAIKRFAKYRRDADGRFTERSLQEYLVLATVLETCEFNNLNVLKFLLSKEATLEVCVVNTSPLNQINDFAAKQQDVNPHEGPSLA